MADQQGSFFDSSAPQDRASQQTVNVTAEPKPEQSLVSLNPDAPSDPEIAKQAVSVLGEVRPIVSEPEHLAANQWFIDLTAKIKAIQAERKRFVGPLQATTRLISERFDRVIRPLEVLHEKLEREILRYRFEQERKQKEAAEAARRAEEEAKRQKEAAEAAARMAKEEADAAVAKAAATADPKVFAEQERRAEEKEQEAARAREQAQQAERHQAQAIIAAPEPPKKTVKTETGASSTKSEHYTFEVTDIDLVERRFLVLDPTLVNKAIRAGLREAPGLRIYDKGKLSARTGRPAFE